jgi:hypothetical protein
MSKACAAQVNRTRQGMQFEIFVEGLFRHYHKGVQRNTVFELLDSRDRRVCSAQIDISSKIFSLFKDTYGLFELKHSSEFTINEDAVNQLYDAYKRISRQSMVNLKPVAVVTNKDFTSGAYALAEKYSIQMINGAALQKMYDKTCWFSKPSIESVIKSIRVSDYSTKPNYVHISV